MPVTVNDIVELVNRIAPFSLAEEWDNVGLLVGDRESEVSKVLVAMDATEPVIDEAIAGGFQMIVTHHPIMFHGIQNVSTDFYEGRLLRKMIQHDIALCVCHTNFDKTIGGTNDALADIACLREDRKALIPEDGAWEQTKAFESLTSAEQIKFKNAPKVGMGRIGGLISPCSFGRLCRHVTEGVGAELQVIGNCERIIEQAAVMCGTAGRDEILLAKQMGADAIVCGEVKYHDRLFAEETGICLIDAGHYHSEHPGVIYLTAGLQEKADELQYKLDVCETATKSLIYSVR